MIFRIAALGIGAFAMYYLDPVSGKRRRALLRDKLTRARHQAGGIVAEARSAIERRSAQRQQPDRRDAQPRWPVDPVDIDLS